MTKVSADPLVGPRPRNTEFGRRIVVDRKQFIAITQVAIVDAALGPKLVNF